MSQPLPSSAHRSSVRYVLSIAAVLLIIAGLGTVKFRQISSLIAMGKEMEKSGPPPESVGSTIAQEQSWEGTISSIGSVAAVRGVALSNDSPGVVSHIFFESGALVRQGQVLVELRHDASSARSSRPPMRGVTSPQISGLAIARLVEKAAIAATRSSTTTTRS